MTQSPPPAPLGFGRSSEGEPIAWTRANVVGVTVATVLFLLLLGTTYENYLRDQVTEQNGLELAEASQNARSGLDLIARDLRDAESRGAGHGPWILVGSQYRVTFVCDLDGDRRIDEGETITYFLDPNWRDAPISSKPNPYGFVLRRKVGARGDSLATPTLGEGEIVAYGLSQRSDDHVTTKNVSLFSYRDSLGAPLELGAGAVGDPAGVFFGLTVPGVYLAARPGADGGVRSIRIRMVAETKERDRETGRYDRVTVGSTIGLEDVSAPGTTFP